MERSYIAFISYKHVPRDAAIAKEIHTSIEKYIVPKALRKDGSRKLGIVFRDEEELPISSDLSESIRNALDSSQYLITICSPEARESQWVGREIEHFLKGHDRKNAFVVLASGEPQEVFPAALTRALDEATGQWQEVEPLALDVRADSLSASRRKLRRQIKKLYAGMLGCSYDSLVQREKVRRNRRMLAAGAVLLALSLAFTGFVVDRNRKLADAYHTSLMNEARMMTDEAVEALAAENPYEALRLSADVLRTDEVERPYYAPAESVLFSVLEPFGTGQPTPLVAQKELVHNAPVEKLVFDNTGSRVFTIDAYGTLSCFDADSGALCWDEAVAGSQRLFLSGIKDAQLYYDPIGELLVCGYKGAIVGISPDTGSEVWRYHATADIVSGSFFDAQGQTAAFLQKEFITDKVCTFTLIGLSTKDGQELYAIPVLQNASHLATAFPAGDGSSSAGTFLDDHTFAGTYYVEESDRVRTVLYTVTHETGSVQQMEAGPLASDSQRYNYLRTVDLGGGLAAIVYDASLKGGDGFYVECIDTATGTIAWSTLATEAEAPIDPQRLCFYAKDDNVLLASGKSMYLISRQTGEVKSFLVLKAGIAALFPVEGKLFGYVLEDGYYALGYISKSGRLNDSSYYGLTIRLPETAMAQAFNAGLLIEDDDPDAPLPFTALPLAEGGGRMAVVGSDRSSVFVTSVPCVPDAPKSLLYTVPGRSAHYADQNAAGTIVLAPLYQKAKSHAALMMPGSSEAVLLTDLDGHLLEKYLLTADSQTLIACGPTGDLLALGADGSMETLSSPKSKVLFTVDDTDYITAVYESDAARLAAGGQILAARCDGETIDLWVDGALAEPIALPEGMRWSMVLDAEQQELFKVGENGLLVLSDFASDTEPVLANFMVYDLQSRNWKTIPDEGRGGEERVLAFAADRPLFAVHDSDANLRVYDFESGKCLKTIDAKVPAASVEYLHFVPEENALLLGTKDGQISLYSLADGSRILRESLHVINDTNSNCGYSTWYDQADRRLYISAHGHCVCYDTRQWTQLFALTRQDQFLCLNTAQNTVVLTAENGTTDSFSALTYTVPGTEALLDTALQILQ